MYIVYDLRDILQRSGRKRPMVNVPEAAAAEQHLWRNWWRAPPEWRNVSARREAPETVVSASIWGDDRDVSVELWGVENIGVAGWSFPEACVEYGSGYKGDGRRTIVSWKLIR